MNRRRREITSRYPELAFLGELAPGQVLDGEIVVLRKGKPDFPSLQRREQARSPRQIGRLSRALPATFVAFDQLYLNYNPLLNEKCVARRHVLQGTIKRANQPRLVFSDGIVGGGLAYFRAAVEQGLEGIVAKRLGSRYLPGKRTDAWIKIKRGDTVACVVIGFIPEGKDDFGSLILAAPIDGQLTYIGKVGSGFDAEDRRRINPLLRARLREKPVVACKLKGRWVEPELYCAVRCMERTSRGHLRAPVFEKIGLLKDEPHR
jgi:ATP-dependent DNA ligase